VGEQATIIRIGIRAKLRTVNQQAMKSEFILDVLDVARVCAPSAHADMDRVQSNVDAQDQMRGEQ